MLCSNGLTVLKLLQAHILHIHYFNGQIFQVNLAEMIAHLILNLQLFLFQAASWDWPKLIIPFLLKQYKYVPCKPFRRHRSR